jgi:uncharacterized membrane protein YozB (DUF420 family)
MYEEMMEKIIAYLPIIIPLAIIQLGLMVFALIHALKHPYYRFGDKVLWILMIVVVNIIGPILYFVIGRGEAPEEDDG